jgi:hypothetical protein
MASPCYKHPRGNRERPICADTHACYIRLSAFKAETNNSLQEDQLCREQQTRFTLALDYH